MNLLGLLLVVPASVVPAQDVVLVEAETLATLGGWSVDTLAVEAIGSPYLLAHGLGVPVEDATGEVVLPGGGSWRAT